MKMDQSDIDGLIEKFKESGLGVMEYEEDGFRFRIEKEPSVVLAAHPQAPAGYTGAGYAGAVSGYAANDAAVNAAVNGNGAAAVNPADIANANGIGANANAVTEANTAASAAETIDSPIVGVFYQAAAPGEEPFVKEGDRVSKGDVVCVVEAMKVMNEIRASYDCRISKVLAADGGMVEFGSALFEVERL